ncbi:zinc ribbon domain-containing protein [Pseudothauera nasutitermitis]|uniref:Zinc ribbon domain-containing protein n=1 Tax=Pseudothauera nasutitermitis TaxID=2565930 RepID=A0A4S4AYC2_9RHOO|nr:zinc ribbon domain-containing protein [Pseudothauera nasutitermitis]THF63622.1 zinc ribbon domain-containing protein [Pseudothauera nasutitermitis]
MPIYEYRCQSCGFQKEHMQKMSDAPLTNCPSCGAESYTKLLSAAGFQLKGSGWYATDFKGGSSSAKPAAKEAPATGGCGGGCACHPS